MGEISNNKNINLNSYYTSKSKVEKPERMVASAPENIPKPHLFNDIDANNRLKAIHNDIYQRAKKENARHNQGFWGTIKSLF